jgi:phosphatidylinositol glycan class Z
LAIIRLHFALSNSYIHPDEHFQGPEVVVGNVCPCTLLTLGKLFGWQTSLPWEFTDDNPVHSPIRSILPIWMVYGIPIWIIKWIHGGNTLQGGLALTAKPIPTPCSYSVR